MIAIMCVPIFIKIGEILRNRGYLGESESGQVEKGGKIEQFFSRVTSLAASLKRTFILLPSTGKLK